MPFDQEDAPSGLGIRPFEPARRESVEHDEGAVRCACPACAGLVDSDGTSPGGDPVAFLDAADRGDLAPNGKPSKTVAEAAYQLNRTYASWNDFWTQPGVSDVDNSWDDPYWGGAPSYVTFAFRSSISEANMPDDTGGFYRFTESQIAATLLALQSWSDAANVVFNRVGAGTTGEGAYSNSATMLFGNYTTGAEGAAAFAYYPSGSATGGDVWINTDYDNPLAGNYAMLALIHEIGHAIGFSHPGDYNAGEGVTITYAANAEYYEDSRQYTVMSYFGASNTGASHGGAYAATILLDDIAAAQRTYGVNTTTRTGDTVYGFNSTADRPWFAATSSTSKLIFAVWDAGGVDTLDFSGYSQAQTITLIQGHFSSVGGLTGNVAIAIGAVIENAIGGSGADTLIGNAAGNRLTGGAGNDTLTGHGGADIFVASVGGGADTITDFSAASDLIDVSAFGGYLSAVQSGLNTIVTVAASITFTLLNVTATALTAANFITGASPGYNVINGTSGADTLNGTAAADQISGLASNDTINGLAGDDWLSGGDGDDTIDAGSGVDTVFGNAGNDVFRPSTVSSGLADSTYDGGDGVDTFDYSVAASFLSFSVAQATPAEIVVGDNRITNVERIIGGSAGDIFGFTYLNYVIEAYGGGGDDSFYGGVSGSKFYGEDGDDNFMPLSAGTNLDGGAGNDTFFVSGAFGAPAVHGTVAGGSGIDLLKLNISFDVDLQAQTAVSGVATYTVTSIEQVMVAAHGGYLTTVRGTAAGEVFSVNSLFNDGSVGVVFEGRGGDDTLSGSAGDDTLDGGTGADAMAGGGGNDGYVVDNAGDVVTEGASAGTDTVTTSLASYTLGANLENLAGTSGAGQALTGNGLANSITGGAGADTITGGGGDDFLFGGDGNDALLGGDGVDTFRGEQGSDSLTGGAGADVFIVTLNGGADTITDFSVGSDRIDLSAYGYYQAIAASGADTLITISSGVTVRLKGVAVSTVTDAIFIGLPTGGAMNEIIGTNAAETILGTGQADHIVGLAGIDVIRSGAGDDWIEGGTEADKLYGDAGADRLDGDAGNDQLFGGDGGDSLTGGAGNDSLIGGAGADTYVMSLAGGADAVIDFELGVDLIDATAFGGYLSIVQSGTDAVVTFASGVTLRLKNTTAASITDASFIGLSGPPPAGYNLINGTTSGETLNGTAASDQIYGLAGDDTLNGGDSADWLEGGADNDLLNGGAGADVMIGGAGDDTYVVDNAGDAVTEAAGGGGDTVQTTLAAYTLGAELENLTGTSGAGQALTGNGLANVITGAGGADTLNGGEGNDRLNGGTGADAMTGGAGDDTFVVDNAGDTTVEAGGGGTDTVETGLATYTLAAEVENLAGTSGAGQALTGNSLANTITGGAGADTITGGGGADALRGNGGADVFVATVGGGADTIADFVAGVDRINVAAFGDYQSIVQSGADTLVTVAAGVTFRLTGVTASTVTAGSFIGLAGPNVITGTSAGDILNGTAGVDHISGLDGNDTLRGGDGDDQLDGGIGADKLFGEAGNDTLIGGDSNDLMDGGAGADMMTGGLGSDTYLIDDAGDVVTEGVDVSNDVVQTALATYVLPANVETLFGTSASGQTLTGTVLANTITGAGGADTLHGLAGADILNGGAGGDTLYGGADSDKLYGDAGDDFLFGGDGNDALLGGDGVDTFQGEQGSDSLTGGAGADVFIVTLNGGADTITDFSVGSDRIDLSAYGFYQAIAASGADTLITISSGVTVRLKGVAVSTVTDAIFIGLPTGGAMNEIIGTNAAETILGTGQADHIVGLAGIDVIRSGAGDDWIEGGSEADKLYGDAGADRLDGDAGNDQLFGGDGGDSLTGGAGNDSLIGGAGADTYVMSLGGGADAVIDFELGVDLIDATAFGGYLSIVQSGTDAVVTFASGVTLRLKNIAATGVTDASFIGLSSPAPADPPAFASGPEHPLFAGSAGGDAWLRTDLTDDGSHGGWLL